MPADRIIGLYEENAEAWAAARLRLTTQERPWIDRFAALLAPGATVLDLGCGSGRPVAAALIARNINIVGVDSSPSLIALAAARFPDQDWRVADMRALALRRQFEGVLAWHSLFHLAPADQAAMFARFAAHAAPGAPLLFTSGPDAGEAIGEWRGEPLYSASLAPDQNRALLAEQGFEYLDCALPNPEEDGISVWLARRRASLPAQT